MQNSRLLNDPLEETHAAPVVSTDSKYDLIYAKNDVVESAKSADTNTLVFIVLKG